MVASKKESVIVDGSENSSGSLVRPSWGVGSKVKELPWEGREWGVCLQRL